MDELAAREVLLVRALDSAAAPPPGWTVAERRSATRMAVEQAGPGATPEAFIAARAHAGLRRLLSREEPAARAVWGWLQRPLPRRGPVVIGLAAGLLLGVLVDYATSRTYINLLSLTVFGVLGWNVAVYSLLLVRGLARLAGAGPGSGPLVRSVARLAGPAAGAAERGVRAAGLGGVWPAFMADWSRASAPLVAATAAATLHAAAAGFAAGGVAHLYVRGLLLDYRVGWESTFLEPGFVHGVLVAVLGPAAALTGIALPDVAGVVALRLGAGSPGAPAAAWIHLYAVTVGLAVVLPRSLLAGLAATLAQRRTSRFPLALDAPYFQQLLRQHRSQPARVRVWPHAATPTAAATLGLRSACAQAWGDNVVVEVGPAVGFGDEDLAVDPVPDTSIAIALFDLAATPEAEQQGRLLETLVARLPAAVPVVMVIDEAAFRARLGGFPERLAQRRTAWSTLAAAYGTVPVFVDLTESPGETDAAGLEAALDRPVRILAG